MPICGLFSGYRPSVIGIEVLLAVVRIPAVDNNFPRTMHLHDGR